MCYRLNHRRYVVRRAVTYWSLDQGEARTPAKGCFRTFTNVVNAETRQVWQLACEGGRCTKQVFAHSDAFKRPFRLEITRDGRSGSQTPRQAEFLASTRTGLSAIRSLRSINRDQ